jgi:hypothetical protein
MLAEAEGSAGAVYKAQFLQPDALECSGYRGEIIILFYLLGSPPSTNLYVCRSRMPFNAQIEWSRDEPSISR